MLVDDGTGADAWFWGMVFLAAVVCVFMFVMAIRELFRKRELERRRLELEEKLKRPYQYMSSAEEAQSGIMSDDDGGTPWR